MRRYVHFNKIIARCYLIFLASQLLSALITLIDVLNIIINEINNSPIIKFVAFFKFESCLPIKNE